MGILKEPAQMIERLPLPEGFSVCELGDQQMSHARAPMVASEFYRQLGCGRYESIDGNGLGTITADLNLPLNIGAHAPDLIDGFDLVTDFGTGEHIFDQAQVWRTIHELTKPGGYIAFDRPHQGYGKHCFYLVNPCLIGDLASANGYKIVHLKKTQTPRGWLVRGVFRTSRDQKPFRHPQQSRYSGTLRVPLEGL